MTALPPALDRFGAELENAVRRDLGARRRRRRMLRAAALSAAAAAAAFGLLSALPTGGPSVVERAAAALEPPDDTILHYQLTAEQRNPDGSVVTWRSESWQLRAAPFTSREIEVGQGIRAETLTRGDTNELYDVRTNTIYVASRQQLVAAHPLRIKIVPKSKIATLARDPRADTVFVIGKGGKDPTVVATEQGARRLRERLAQGGKKPTADQLEGPRGEILALLESGRARETGRVEVADRDAIRIESADGRQVYLVDAETYAPIEWTSTGNGGGVTLRFPVYEQLPVDTESMELLDLEAQHPGVRVVRDVAAYRAAEGRLFPHG